MSLVHPLSKVNLTRGKRRAWLTMTVMNECYNTRLHQRLPFPGCKVQEFLGGNSPRPEKDALSRTVKGCSYSSENGRMGGL